MIYVNEDAERLRLLLKRLMECTCFHYPAGSQAYKSRRFFYAEGEQDTVEIAMRKSLYDEIKNALS